MTLPTDIAERLRFRIQWNAARRCSESYLYQLALDEIERLREGRNIEAELRAALAAENSLRLDAERERDAVKEQVAVLEPRIEKAKSAYRKVKAERDEFERQLIAADNRRDEVPV